MGHFPRAVCFKQLELPHRHLGICFVFQGNQIVPVRGPLRAGRAGEDRDAPRQRVIHRCRRCCDVQCIIGQANQGSPRSPVELPQARRRL